VRRAPLPSTHGKLTPDRLITAKDHASIQIQIADVDADGKAIKGKSTTIAICGRIRAQGDSDDSINRIATKEGRELTVTCPCKDVRLTCSAEEHLDLLPLDWAYVYDWDVCSWIMRHDIAMRFAVAGAVELLLIFAEEDVQEFIKCLTGFVIDLAGCAGLCDVGQPAAFARKLFKTIRSQLIRHRRHHPHPNHPRDPPARK